MDDTLRKLDTLDPNATDFVHRFDEFLAELSDCRDPKLIEALMERFPAIGNHDESGYAILHAIEDFDDATYCEHVLIGMPRLAERSPRWASILLMRILNSDATREELVLHVRRTDAMTKDAMANLLRAIERVGPEFRAKTTSVLLAATARN